MKKCCRETRRFRHRITIQQRTKGTNASGEVTDTWSTYATRWADIEPTGARETTVGGRQTVAEVGYRITLHSDAQTRAITPQMRVSYDGRQLNIGGKYDEGERREFIKLLCTEKVNP